MNTIFEKMRISLKTYFILIESFLMNLRAKETEEILGLLGYKLTTVSINKHFNNFKSLISNYYKDNIPLIEFTGEIEIDEVYLSARRRGKNGRIPRKGAIVMGLFNRTTKEIALYHIVDATTVSILPILIDVISPDSTIFSDQLSVYVNK
jgi:hypothetical protein